MWQGKIITVFFRQRYVYSNCFPSTKPERNRPILLTVTAEHASRFSATACIIMYVLYAWPHYVPTYVCMCECAYTRMYVCKYVRIYSSTVAFHSCFIHKVTTIHLSIEQDEIQGNLSIHPKTVLSLVLILTFDLVKATGNGFRLHHQLAVRSEKQRQRTTKDMIKKKWKVRFHGFIHDRYWIKRF